MTTIRYQQLPGILSTVCASETILVHPATGNFYRLSPSASVAWSALAQPRTPSEIIETVRSRHTGMPLTAAADITALLAELQAEGLLVPAPPVELATYTTPTLHRGTRASAANNQT